jgi:anti-sigma factor ChrR (cupin superfamily)
VEGLKVLPLNTFETQNTALVRWAPQTFFNPHRHWGGEEILVIEGVFSDEHGDYPAGSWLRSPHMSQHQPFSREGCLILVKTGHLV